LKKRILLFLLFIYIAKVFSLELPQWVINPPQKDNVKFAVGISNKFTDKTIEKNNAFDVGCYLLACQDEIIVKSEMFEISGTNEVIYNHVVKVDSSRIEYYKKNAIIIAEYSDYRFSYLLVATQKCKVSVEMQEVDQVNFPFHTYSLENTFFGYGIENYSSAIGLIYSTHSAITNLGLQIKSDIKSIQAEKDNLSINMINDNSDLVLRGIIPFKHYISYERNIFITYVMKKE